MRYVGTRLFPDARRCRQQSLKNARAAHPAQRQAFRLKLVQPAPFLEKFSIFHPQSPIAIKRRITPQNGKNKRVP